MDPKRSPKCTGSRPIQTDLFTSPITTQGSSMAPRACRLNSWREGSDQIAQQRYMCMECPAFACKSACSFLDTVVPFLHVKEIATAFSGKFETPYIATYDVCWMIVTQCCMGYVPFSSQNIYPFAVWPARLMEFKWLFFHDHCGLPYMLGVPEHAKHSKAYAFQPSPLLWCALFRRISSYFPVNFRKPYSIPSSSTVMLLSFWLSLSLWLASDWSERCRETPRRDLKSWRPTNSPRSRGGVEARVSCLTWP